MASLDSLGLTQDIFELMDSMRTDCHNVSIPAFPVKSVLPQNGQEEECHAERLLLQQDHENPCPKQAGVYGVTTPATHNM